MATTFTSATPTYNDGKVKVFSINVPADDLINVATILVFPDGGMTDFEGTPNFWYCYETTNAAAAPAAVTKVSIYNVTRFGFSTMKTTIAGAAHTHRFTVVMMLHTPKEL